MTNYAKLSRADLVDALEDDRSLIADLRHDVGVQHERHEAALRLVDELLAHIHFVHSGPQRSCLRGECVRFRLARQEVA